MTTYHLWIKPSGKVYDFLRDTIRHLSQSYQGPFFEPHVTLLSSLPGNEDELSARLFKLGSSLQPFTLYLTDPAYGDQYFQCVFLKVQNTEEMMQAHQLANEIFGKVPAAYMPHVSLLYGHHSSQLKEKIAKSLPNSLQLRFPAERIELIRSESEDPKDWEPILTVPLKKLS